MSNAQHEISNEHQQRDEKERDGGTSGKIASLNAEGEGKRGKGLRGVKRAASREDIDDGHIGKGEDEAEKHGHAENGPHHGNDDLELRAPETCAIHGGGFGDVLGNGGAPSAIGATHGSKIRKRMKPRPRNGCSRAMARILAPTITTIWEQMVKINELRMATRKLGLCRMLRKFSRPT